MFTFLLILAILAALILFPAILFQAGQGGGLATQFGGGSSTDAFVGGRQAATLLHKAAWWAGGGFLFICFVLQLIGGRSSAPRSLTEEELRRQNAQQAAPAPIQQSLPITGSGVPGQGNAPAAPAPAAPQGQTKRPTPAR
jgi:protein translocase SecG subunit